MTTSVDLSIFRIAAGQEGVFSREQAIDAGMSDRCLRRRVERGDFHVWAGRVLSLPDWPTSESRLLHAGTLAVPGSAGARRTAAQLLTLPAVAPSREPTLVIPKGGFRDLPGLVVHESRTLTAADITTVGALPVTTPCRTLIDLAAELGWGRFEYVLDRCVQAERPTLPQLVAAFTSMTRRGRRGAAKMSAYLDSRFQPPPVALSDFEWRFERLLERRGVRRPVRQFRPPWYDGLRGIADYAAPDRKVIVELDGRSFHSTMQAFKDDRRRDRLAHRHGWTPLRYTFVEMQEQVDEMIAELLHFLGPA